jgi:hypothetical protein
VIRPRHALHEAQLTGHDGAPRRELPGASAPAPPGRLSIPPTRASLATACRNSESRPRWADRPSPDEIAPAYVFFAWGQTRASSRSRSSPSSVASRPRHPATSDQAGEVEFGEHLVHGQERSDLLERREERGGTAPRRADALHGDRGAPGGHTSPLGATVERLRPSRRSQERSKGRTCNSVTIKSVPRAYLQFDCS